jgi:hypothetical protein
MAWSRRVPALGTHRSGYVGTDPAALSKSFEAFSNGQELSE